MKKIYSNVIFYTNILITKYIKTETAKYFFKFYIQFKINIKGVKSKKNTSSVIYAYVMFHFKNCNC